MQTERLHAMDAVRGLALLSGVVLHAAMSFMPGLTAFGFPADSSQSPALQIVFYVIHVFRMPLFFFIAGYFGHLAFHRKGVSAFARDRAKRILIPLLVGWVAFGPMVMGMIYIHLGPTPVAASAPPQQGLPLSHLWFLYYLLMVYVLTIGFRAIALKYTPKAGPMRNRIDLIVQRAIQKDFAALLIAAPIAACLYFTPNWMMWGGVPTPDNGLTPQLPALAAYGVAFIFGWLLHRQSELLNILGRRWGRHLVAAAALTALSFWLVGKAANPFAVPPMVKLAYAMSYTLAAWNWIFGLVGAALCFCSSENRVRRYLADSSYWIYLAHLPVVFALQLIVLKWPLHWSIKFPLILSAAMSALLLSYHFLVRNTVIGEVLNGRRYGAKPRTELTRSSPAKNDGDVIAELTQVQKQFGSKTALDGIDLQVRRGEVLALLGPNGAGKSTAISLLLGLQRADAGRVAVFGCEAESEEVVAARRRIGVMLQEVTLPAEMRVGELLELTSSYYPAPLEIPSLLALTNTASIADRPYGLLSGGQQRLTQFAMAVCGRPQLLFLDEPTTGLDIEARETLWATVRKLVEEGCSVVLTTHYLEEAEALADRIAVINKGRIVSQGNVDEIRSVVGSKRISCVTSVSADLVKHWPNVMDASLRDRKLEITTSNAEAIVRRLLNADSNLRELQVKQAGLAEAFIELTWEAA